MITHILMAKELLIMLIFMCQNKNNNFECHEDCRADTLFGHTLDTPYDVAYLSQTVFHYTQMI